MKPAGSERCGAKLCDHCEQRPATCLGQYDNMEDELYACDACCGHGNEDGWCKPIDEPAPKVEAAGAGEPQRIAEIRRMATVDADEYGTGCNYSSLRALLAEIDRLRARVAELTEELANAHQRIADLQRVLEETLHREPDSL